MIIVAVLAIFRYTGENFYSRDNTLFSRYSFRLHGQLADIRINEIRLNCAESLLSFENPVESR